MAIGPPVRRRNAETHVQPHFGVRPLGGKTAVARQRGRRPPQILAARGRPPRWRGRWRVGSIICCRVFLRQTPNSAKLRPPRPPRPELRGVDQPHAKKGERGGVCDPRVFCASKMPSFLARLRVRGRPAVRGPAGTGSVGDGVGEGATTISLLLNADAKSSCSTFTATTSAHAQPTKVPPRHTTGW